MPASAGKRYIAASGAQVIVTKGGPGELTDGATPLASGEQAPVASAERDEPLLAIGKRYRSADGEVELLVIRTGVCDLRYNGAPMELMQPKILPSAD
jgi:hypothetical protein